MTMCGTPNYISPEIATRASHGLETDVWGLGVMLYTILVGKAPFDTDDGIKSTLTLVVMSDIEFPQDLSSEVRDLMASLLKKNPKDRIKLSKILEHPFMTRYQSMFSSSSRWGSSHDSGVITSSCLTSKSYSNPNSVLPSVLSNNILPPRGPQPPFSRSSSSVPASFGDILASQAPSFRNMTPSQPTANNCSCCSRSSNHLCPSVSKNISSGGWQNTEYSSNPGSRCPIGPGSGGISSHATTNQRCYSNPPSMAFKDTNCSHAWKQCAQCSHTDSCGCFYNKNNCPSGCAASCNHSNANFSGFVNSHQPEVAQSGFFQPQNQAPHKHVAAEKPESPKSNLPNPPINSKRLRPIRQKTKNVVLNILDSGEVCLEFLRNKDRAEKVVEVLRISSDGLRVNNY